jgi:hypothetical protein
VVGNGFVRVPARDLGDRNRRTGRGRIERRLPEDESGGARAGALARTLTTMVGGPEPVAKGCMPIFEAFLAHVLYMGGPGAGQHAKLLNNTMMTNQTSVEDVVELASDLNMNAPALVTLLQFGSASSLTLKALNHAITTDNVNHLQELELLDPLNRCAGRSAIRSRGSGSPGPGHGCRTRRR